MTVLRRCVSWWGEVKWLEEVYHLTGSVTVIREIVMERCDGHWGGVRGLRAVMVIREV